MLKDRLKILESKIKSLLEDWKQLKARNISLEDLLVQKNDRIEELEILMASLEEDVQQAEKFTEDTLDTLNKEEIEENSVPKENKQFSNNLEQNNLEQNNLEEKEDLAKENEEKDYFPSDYFKK